MGVDPILIFFDTWGYPILHISVPGTDPPLAGGRPAAVCCVIQQTCLLSHAADMSVLSHSRHVCCVTQQTCLLREREHRGGRPVAGGCMAGRRPAVRWGTPCITDTDGPPPQLGRGDHDIIFIYYVSHMIRHMATSLSCTRVTKAWDNKLRCVPKGGGCYHHHHPACIMCICVACLMC